MAHAGRGARSRPLWGWCRRAAPCERHQSDQDAWRYSPPVGTRPPVPSADTSTGSDQPRAFGATGPNRPGHIGPAPHRPVSRPGFGHIVIRPRVQRGDLVTLLPAGREHQDRHLAPLAQAPDHLQPVEIRQPAVKDQEVWLPRLRFPQPLGNERPPHPLAAKPPRSGRRTQEHLEPPAVLTAFGCGHLSQEGVGIGTPVVHARAATSSGPGRG